MIWAGAGSVSFVGPFFYSSSVSHGSHGSLGFFFSLPFLYLPFLSGVNAISCHDANRVFSFLIVSHDDILQTNVRMQGSRNQDVPTPYSPTLCFWLSFCAYVRYLPLLTLCIHSPLPDHTSHHRLHFGFDLHVSFSFFT